MRNALAGALDHERTPLNGVNQDVPALEKGVVAPGTNKLQAAPVLFVVILRVDVEEANLLNQATSRVLG